MASRCRSAFTEIGKALLRRFAADAEFWGDSQCVLERRPDGQWIVTPAAGTVNEKYWFSVLPASSASVVEPIVPAGMFERTSSLPFR